MHGLLISEMEREEMEYLLKRELEELIFDLEDHRIDKMVKQAMQERYTLLFNFFKRIAPHTECLKYMPRKKKQQ
ncbi:hypothetical protein [Thalassobacillus pellis]|uniref:hypothetical protein n=1 Tax=Thalassobacillus pellis TaxID=748008 RepID=UPI00196147EB|nr:hypothetical protein [Thalassobacillus pellis]MBM7555046.1 hypothetical protein [Thalassobacillus pellis]